MTNKEQVKSIYKKISENNKMVCGAVLKEDENPINYIIGQNDFFEGQIKALIGNELYNSIDVVIDNKLSSLGCGEDVFDSLYNQTDGDLSKIYSKCMECIGMLDILSNQIGEEMIA
jgi:hypothetical protein